mgnify:CR=1 FL=1
MGLALKCDETEASRSENRLQNVKNIKSLVNVKKIIFAQTIFTHFWGQYHLGRKNKNNAASDGIIFVLLPREVQVAASRKFRIF